MSEYAVEGKLPANTARALLNETREGLDRLDKSLLGLGERLEPVLGPAKDEPMPSEQIALAPKQTSDLVRTIHDLMDTARRLTIRVDVLTQRLEL